MTAALIHGNALHVLLGVVVFVTAGGAWLAVDTIGALKRGKARFRFRIDDRRKNPGWFWFNIVFRCMLIAGMYAASATLVYRAFFEQR